MRRNLLLLLCAALCVLLCACGKTDPPPATTTAATAAVSVTGETTDAVSETRTALTTEATTAAPTTAATTVPTTAAPTTTAAQTTTTAATTTPTTAATTKPTTTRASAPATTRPAATTAATTARATTRPATTTTAPTTKATTAPTTTQPQTLTCTLAIDCKTLLNHLDELDESKRALVPQNGVLLSSRSVTFTAGESVFDVLKRTCRQNGLQMEFSIAPLYQTAYIEGIGNLYEFDGGPASGWMYSVNGVFPNYGCADYKLENGDVIAWRYTCNLGGDIGGHNNYS